MGPEAKRVEMLGGHTRVSESVDIGEVEAWWECCTQYVGRAKARTWVDTWNWAKAEGIFSGKATGEAGDEGRPHEPQGCQRRSRLDELTFGTFNVRTAAVNGVNGIGHIDTDIDTDTLRRPGGSKDCDVFGLQEIK